MKWTLTTKFLAVISGVILLAVASSGAALFAAWSVAGLMRAAVTENLPSVRAAEELENALLDQKGLASAFILDGGNPQWLKRLSAAQTTFDQWLLRARPTAHTPEEVAILDRLEEVYRRYDAERNEAIALIKAGDRDRAVKVIFGEVQDLYGEAYEECERFVDANEAYVNLATAMAEVEIRRNTWLTGICVVLTVALGIVLLWLFGYQVIFPLRRMVRDVRAFGGGSLDADRLSDDELESVGMYLKALMSDVSDARVSMADAKARMLHAEKLASVGKLAASVAHEMRNPLSAMKMRLFSIRKILSEQDLEPKFQVISDDITRLEKIVRNFLEFARPPQLNCRPCCIDEIVSKAIELIEHRLRARRVQVAQEHGRGLPRVMADAEPLTQVLVNLLDNAAEAMNAGGTIHVSTTWADTDGDRHVELRVRDTGAGIPSACQDRVFEPFFTTKPDGTGLGLCIAASIMAEHGGRLVLESSSDAGTAFAVWIPVAREVSDGHSPRRGR